MLIPLPPAITATALLILSNVFMTFAWYAHLKNLSGKPWFIAALASWGIALFEYLLQVPANRIGYTTLSLPQLKILQEIITLAVFVPFRGFLHAYAAQARLPVGGAVHGGCSLVHVPRRGEPGVKAAHYTRTALSLHWLIAGLIIAAVFMGWTMTRMEITPARLKLFNYHKWVGVTVLALALLRLSWRLTHSPPPLEPMPGWQQAAAHGGHALLYLLMLAVPVTGWIYSNASGYPVVYLGKLPLPNLLERNRELAGTLRELHVALATALVAVVVLHVLAALQHHFVHRDNTLRRMLAWRR